MFVDRFSEEIEVYDLSAVEKILQKAKGCFISGHVDSSCIRSLIKLLEMCDSENEDYCKIWANTKIWTEIIFAILDYFKSHNDSDSKLAHVMYEVIDDFLRPLFKNQAQLIEGNQKEILTRFLQLKVHSNSSSIIDVVIDDVFMFLLELNDISVNFSAVLDFLGPFIDPNPRSLSSTPTQALILCLKSCSVMLPKMSTSLLDQSIDTLAEIILKVCSCFFPF